jgi:hypothetical protein
MRNRLFPALLASALWALVPHGASAEPGRAALVIGNGTYQGASLPACSDAARTVGTWLRQRGFEVEEAIDASSVAMRSAIGNFVAQASGSPQKTAIVYVCTYAAVSNQRLFMLPVDSDPHQPTRLETQGVIVKALLNTLAGTSGVLFADFGLAPDKNAADAIDALQAGLPPGVRFAFVARDDAGIGSLGRSLPGLLGSAGQDWGRLATVFQAQQGPSRPDRLAVFAPLTGPMPPVQEGAPAAVAQATPAPAAPPAPVTSPSPAAPPAPATPPAAVALAQPAPATPHAEPPRPPAAAPAPAAPVVPAPPQPAAPTPPVAAQTASVSPAPQPPAAEAAKAPAGAPLQLVPPARPAGSAPQVADVSGLERQGPVVPDAAAPEAGAIPPAEPTTPAVRATPPARPADTRTGRIQAALARRGFYSGAVTGRSDGRTREAIRAFQSSIGDAPSGVLTQIQIAKLLNLGR